MLRKWFDPHALLITALIFMAIAGLSGLHFQLHFLNPLSPPKEKDYDITDILYSQLLPREAGPDADIILVNVGLRPDRAKVAAILGRIIQQDPKAIGVDIIFEDRPSSDPASDSLLREAVRACGDHIVLGQEKVWDTVAQAYRPEPLLAGLDNGFARTGYVNLPYLDPLATVRFFEPYHLAGKDTLHAFATALAGVADPLAASRLEARGSTRERIHFQLGDNGFVTVQAEALLADSNALDPAFFRDRIVLLGAIGNGTVDEPFTDRHFTPLNPHYLGNSLPDMAGLALQANILRMILDGTYVKDVPLWIDLLLALLLCYASLLLLIRISHRTHGFYHPLARLYQIGLFALLFVIVAWLYHAWRLHWDFSLGMAALALAVDGQLIYFSILEGIRKRRSRST